VTVATDATTAAGATTRATDATTAAGATTRATDASLVAGAGAVGERCRVASSPVT
jgi:hypothetical protein